MDHPPKPNLPRLVFRHSARPETHQPPDLRLHYLLRPHPGPERPRLPPRRCRKSKSSPPPPRRHDQNLRHPPRPESIAEEIVISGDEISHPPLPLSLARRRRPNQNQIP